jgi:cytidine deaminase
MASDRATLTAAAKEARSRAYAKYSGFLVGAALRTESGEIFAGCNVENVSYGLTMCAERSAVLAAVADGQRSFSALAVVADGGVTPCGACCQVLAEFCDDLPIYLVDSARGDRIEEVRLRELLPRAFRLDRSPTS